MLRLSLALLAVAFAIYSGALIADNIDASGQWLAMCTAIVATMACGSSVALQFVNRRLSGYRPTNDLRDVSEDPVAGEDSTAELAVLPLSKRARPPAFAGWMSWRPAAALAVGGAVALAVLIGLTRTAPVAPIELASAEPATEVSAAPAPQSTAALSTRLVRRTVTGSLARRECLAQVESARLFLNIAQRAPNSSTYTRLTNPEIKRFVASRPVGPYTLQSIAQEMWERRQQPERAAAWWSQQYSRCEEVRIDGGNYVVRG